MKFVSIGFRPMAARWLPSSILRYNIFPQQTPALSFCRLPVCDRLACLSFSKETFDAFICRG